MNTIQLFFLGCLFDVEWESEDGIVFAISVKKNTYEWVDILCENKDFNQALTDAIYEMGKEYAAEAAAEAAADRRGLS